MADMLARNIGAAKMAGSGGSKTRSTKSSIPLKNTNKSNDKNKVEVRR